MLEKDFQANVVELAKITGWRVHHARAVQNFDGRHMTPIQGDAGFPDLVLARKGRVIFAELKSESGRLGEQQLRWLAALAGDWPAGRGGHVAANLEIYVWRPADIDRIGKILSNRS